MLELDCIPAGMELFPAANDDQWTLIKRVIDDCDYYIVIVAGRYGSVSDEGLSYTEMEYRYALERGKPIIGFVHKDIEKIPSGKFDTDSQKQERLSSFRALVQKKLVRYWETPVELWSVVSRSIIKLIKDSPAVGWIKGDNLTADAAREEILRLKNIIENLESKRDSDRKMGEIAAENLANGDDIHDFPSVITVTQEGAYRRERYRWNCETTWAKLFHRISPELIDEGSTGTISSALSEHLRSVDSQNISTF